MPLATRITEDMYVNMRGKGEFARKAYHLAQPIGKCYNIYLGNYGLYEDLGETEIFLDGKDSIVAKAFSWQKRLNSQIEEGVAGRIH